MSPVLIIQSYRAANVPAWIARCLASVQAWAKQAGHDYQLVGDEAFELCGADYLARVGDNVRSITNLARLELVKRAHAAGYAWAVWMDADIFVFDPEAFQLEDVTRYAFARETWLVWQGGENWSAVSAVNNSVFACRAGEPDLDFLISATRHVALHRQIANNYQVGGDLVKGLRVPLAFEMLGNVGMFSSYAVRSLARRADPILAALGTLHGTPIHAANLCATDNYLPRLDQAEALTAMDVLESTRGAMINAGVGAGDPLAPGLEIRFTAPGLAGRLGLL